MREPMAMREVEIAYDGDDDRIQAVSNVGPGCRIE